MEAFPIGIAMNKNLSINMGNCNHRTYIPRLVELGAHRGGRAVETITQVHDIEDAVEAYAEFDTRRPGWLKVELAPAAS